LFLIDCSKTQVGSTIRKVLVVVLKLLVESNAGVHLVSRVTDDYEVRDGVGLPRKAELLAKV